MSNHQQPTPPSNTAASLISKKRLSGQNVAMGSQVEINEHYLVQQHALKFVKQQLEKEINEARAQADDIINQAHQQAQGIVQQGQDQAAQLIHTEREQIKQQCYEDVFNHAAAEAQEAMQRYLDLAQDLFDKAQAYNQKTQALATQNMLQVVQAITNAIIGEEINFNPKVLKSMIEQAVAQLLGPNAQNQGSVQVCVHPETLETLRPLLNTGDAWQLTGDVKCPRDRVFLIHASTRWDISVKQQVEAYTKALAHQLLTEAGQSKDTPEQNTQEPTTEKTEKMVWLSQTNEDAAALVDVETLEQHPSSQALISSEDSTHGPAINTAAESD